MEWRRPWISLVILSLSVRGKPDRHNETNGRRSQKGNDSILKGQRWVPLRRSTVQVRRSETEADAFERHESKAQGS